MHCRYLQTERQTFHATQYSQISRIGVRMPETILIDRDLPRLGLLRFRDGDAQDTILHRGSDPLRINADREGKSARELADRSLGDPVFYFGLIWFLLLRCVVLLHYFAGGGVWCCDSSIVFIFDSSVVVVVILAGLGDCGLRCTFNLSCWWSTSSVGSLDASLDSDGIRVGELNIDIVPFNAGKFTMKFITTLDLPHIEFRIEGLHDASGVVTVCGTIAATVVLKVIEEAEKWVERIGGGVVMNVGQGSWVKESHFACSCW